MRPRVLFIIFVTIMAMILMVSEYQLANGIKRRDELIVVQRVQIKKIQRERKTIGDELKKLQRENVRLKQERDELNRNCVLRSKVRMIGDIPTRSMRKYCYDMAEAWKHVLPMLDKLGTDLGMPNKQKTNITKSEVRNDK